MVCYSNIRCNWNITIVTELQSNCNNFIIHFENFATRVAEHSTQTKKPGNGLAAFSSAPISTISCSNAQQLDVSDLPSLPYNRCLSSYWPHSRPSLIWLFVASCIWSSNLNIKLKTYTYKNQWTIEYSHLLLFSSLSEFDPVVDEELAPFELSLSIVIDVACQKSHFRMAVWYWLCTFSAQHLWR